MKTRLFALGVLGLLLSSPLASAITFHTDLTGVMPEMDSPYTDVDFPVLPEGENLDEWDSYYQNLGILVLSHSLFNRGDELVGYEGAGGTRYFAPDSAINRAEIVQVLYNLTASFTVYPGADLSSCFYDVEGEYWYAEEACAKKEEGVFDGYPDGSFRGENNINHAELIKVIINNYDLAIVDEETQTIWWQGYYEAAVDLNLIMEPESFDPGANPTRGEVIGYILRALTVQYTGEAFTYADMVLFFESLMAGGRSDAYILDSIYSNGEMDFYSLTYEGAAEEEVVTFVNRGSSEVDLSGYSVHVLETRSSSGWSSTGIDFVFPDGTTLAAGEYINVKVDGPSPYSMDYETDSGYGLMNDIEGDYFFILYDANFQIVGALNFSIP